MKELHAHLLDILWLLPVLEILEVVDKAGILHVSPLGQEVQVVWVPQALDKLHFHLSKKSHVTKQDKTKICKILSNKYV
jgi:hypothetical protein